MATLFSIGRKVERVLRRRFDSQSPFGQLDAWEKRWLPLAAASLRDRYPDAYDWLFVSDAQADSAGVVISVVAFVERVEQMASEPALGARGAEARTLLAERGLSASTLDVAKDLLTRLGVTAPPARRTAPAERARTRRREHRRAHARTE
jgi:hypothetical protein